MKGRHRARELALLTLYEVDLTRHTPEEVIRRHLAEDPLAEEIANYARRLVQAVLDHRPQLDAVIQEIAPQWPPQQLAAIDRNILRLAICEMQFLGGIPEKVAIDEAVELAKTFGSDSSRRFINGALGALVSRPTPVEG